MGRRQRGPERCQSPARVSHGCRLAWSGSPDFCPPGADLTTRQESGRPAPRVRWVRTAARGIVRQFALQTLAHRVTAQVGAEVAPVRHGARAGRPGACGTTTLQADFGRVSTHGRRPALAAEFGLASGATVPAAWRVHAGRVRRVLLNEASNHPLISQQIPSISLGTAGRDGGAALSKKRPAKLQLPCRVAAVPNGQSTRRCYGMQEVRGSNPLSSTPTPPQVTALGSAQRRCLPLPDCLIRATRVPLRAKDGSSDSAAAAWISSSRAAAMAASRPAITCW